MSGTTGDTSAAAKLPRDERALRKEVAAWCALLASGQASDSDRSAWQRWHQDHPDHQRAWQRLQAVRTLMNTIPPHIGTPVLQAAPKGRRQALRGLALLVSGGAAGYAVYRHGDSAAPWRTALAQYRTGTGQQRHLRLADGSLLILNTDSAVDIRFDASARTVVLLRGEILVETAHRPQPGAAPDQRPFMVATDHGAMRALGTRFTVRRVADASSVVVLEHAVAVRPARALPGAAPVMVRAGQQMVFNAAGAGPVQPADDTADAWRHGSIVVDDWPLARLVAELGRYRPGHLACDDAVATLRVSGAFPVTDTDQALAVLARSLPVRVRRRTRYWVTLGPA
jgi:transmembrane sensor